jgi:YVTN family beta-propeller protein
VIGILQADDISQNAEPIIIRHINETGQTVDRVLTNYSEYTMHNIDPGFTPEGDYMGGMAYTKDGSKLLLTNRITNNITIYNVSTMTVDTNISVGSYPSGIAVSDSYAIITCPFVDSVNILRISNWSVAAVLPSGTQPWVVRVSGDNHYAYVSCDISNTCEVYDLTTLTRIRSINNFPIYLWSWTTNSENSRISFCFSEFELSPDGTKIFAPNGNDTLYTFNANTGLIIDTLVGIGNCGFLRYAGDSANIVAVDCSNPMQVVRINVDSFNINARVIITDHSVGMAPDAAVNWNGLKAFISISGNQSAIVRFTTLDFVTFSQTLSAFWIGVSPDHARAISGQYNFSIIDFATEQILGQYSGNSQSQGVVAPVGNKAAGIDPHRHEGVYFYDYTNPTSNMYLGTLNAGLDPEGDGPRRVVITNSGVKAVGTNVLSDNASVINTNSNTTEAVLSIGDRAQDLAITSDSRWAVVTGFNSNSVKIIDLNNNTVAAEVLTGSGSGTIVITPSDSFAYVGNIISNTVSVIRLNGTASYNVTNIPCGEIGVVWAGFGVSSGLAVSPTGQYVLVATSFDDNVKVIETASNTVVAILTVGDFPLQAEFNQTGEYAVVTNYFSNNYSVLRIDGASSYVVGTYATGQGPIRLARNPVQDQIAIGNYTAKTVVIVNPTNGNIITTHNYSGYGSINQVGFDELGNLMVLTMATGNIPGHLHRLNDHIVLPAQPTYFSYASVTNRAVVAMPGPDWLSVIQWDAPGVYEITNLKTTPNMLSLNISPGIINNSVTIAYYLPCAENIKLAVYDITGNKIEDLQQGYTQKGSHELSWHCVNLAYGVYFCRLTTNTGSITKQVFVVK